MRRRPLLLIVLASLAALPTRRSEAAPLLEALQLKPSAESEDFVANKKQFQLHGLLTEQRHPKTWNLSFRIRNRTEDGLAMLLSVDEDVTRKLEALARSPEALEQAAGAVEKAILAKRKIYVYGCGATGRLAKQLESSFWRPFWERVAATPAWPRLQKILGDVGNRFIGEMTGGDRALISSLPGFEDLQLIGKLQLQDRGIHKGDVVIAVTEGGETSSVIGTVLAAAAQYGKATSAAMKEARERLYFVYNNPNEVLTPFDRSRAVLGSPAITKINLATGPQAIAGSTRMQATTSETYVLGIVLEHAIARVLERHMTAEELQALGFTKGRALTDRLSDFATLQRAVQATKESLARLTDREADTYSRGRLATYFAADSLVTVFTDSTERSPTFRLLPLDTVQERDRKAWIQVWTPAKDGLSAWAQFLRRPFRGLDPKLYAEPFQTQVEDPRLKEAALAGLALAGDDQRDLYDFSFAGVNRERRAPREGDLALTALLAGELPRVDAPGSAIAEWLKLVADRKATSALVAVVPSGPEGRTLASAGPTSLEVRLPLDVTRDPLAVRQHVGMKMLLNAHSTAVMAKLGRVVGNTMTNVNPGNLKLIGRATYLVLSHVNDALTQAEWASRFGKREPLTYAEANAVLFDAMQFVKGTRRSGVLSEVGLAIVRILETLKKNDAASWRKAESILDDKGLDGYLLELNPKLAG